MYFDDKKNEVLKSWHKLTRTGKNFKEKNIAFIRGIVKDFYYIGNNRYETSISVLRPNNKEDLLKVRFRANKHTDSILEGDKIEIIGKCFSDIGETEDGSLCIQVFVFAEYSRIMDFDEDFVYENLYIIEGIILERPFYRLTYYNKKIIDIKLSINDTSYIPCIALMNLAEELDAIEPSTRIKTLGSIHSKYNPIRIKHELNIRALSFIS